MKNIEKTVERVAVKTQAPQTRVVDARSADIYSVHVPYVIDESGLVVSYSEWLTDRKNK